MAKRYELTIIVNTQAPEGGVDRIVAGFERLLSENGGSTVNVNRLGTRKLAYEIGKQQRGDYTFIRFETSPDVLPEVDRMFKLDESVLRHMVVLDETPVEEEPEAAEEDENTDSDAKKEGA